MSIALPAAQTAARVKTRRLTTQYYTLKGGRDNLMKDKLLIFMCSLVLTLAATGSALAATETGLVLAATESFDSMYRGDDKDDKEDKEDKEDKDDPKCPAQNQKRCDRVDGYFSKNGSTKTCVKKEHKKCPYGKGYSVTQTTWTKMKGEKCKKKVVEKKKCDYRK
jgi:hypothetical protein